MSAPRTTARTATELRACGVSWMSERRSVMSERRSVMSERRSLMSERRSLMSERRSLMSKRDGCTVYGVDA
jgi:hypothetical protein